MKRKREVYDSIAKVVIQIYLDYGIKEFPIDLHNLCERLGTRLIPYSPFDEKDRELLIKKSPKGFFVRGSADFPPTIFYNPYRNEREVRYTIAHEIKHYVYDEDTSDIANDDLADYFARYLICPIPYMIVRGICLADDIHAFTRLSRTASENAAKAIENRKRVYGGFIFDYEIDLLEYLIPVEWDNYRKDTLNSKKGRG